MISFNPNSQNPRIEIISNYSPDNNFSELSKKEALPVEFEKSDTPSLFIRLKAFVFNRLSQVEDRSEQPIPLTHRIHELEQSADEVFIQLNKIKESLVHVLDAKLLKSVHGVLTPMIKEVGRLKKIPVIQPGNVDEQIQVVNRYHQWIDDKIRPWVQVFATQGHDRRAMISAVVQLVIQSSAENIDRDLQVIKEYINHQIVEFSLLPSDKKVLAELLQEALADPLRRLDDLRNPPKGLSIDRLNVWKSDVCHLREVCYNEALHVIDDVLHQVQPTVQIEDAHGKLIVNFKEIIDLEVSVPQLLKEVHLFREKSSIDFTEVDRERLQEMRDVLFVLEDEASKLEDDLELTPELKDRLVQMMRDLHLAKQLLVAY